MGISDFDVKPLFAEPFFRANVGHAISPEQVEFIKNQKMLPNQQNLISENLYLFDEPELASVSEAVQEALDIYAKDVMGIDQKLYVTQSWSLINQPGIGMHTHSHSNSLVSGSLYYTDLPSPNSHMVFDKHSMYQQLVVNPLADKQNIFNTPINYVEPAKHEIFLFSSRLQHAVQPNPSNDVRYSIAFNCFLRGRLGNLRDVSMLDLG